MVPQLPVPSPVGHVSADRVPSLLPQHLLDQFGTGHIHNHQWAILRLPQGAIDFAVFNLMATKLDNYLIEGIGIGERAAGAACIINL